MPSLRTPACARMPSRRCWAHSLGLERALLMRTVTLLSVHGRGCKLWRRQEMQGRWQLATAWSRYGSRGCAIGLQRQLVRRRLQQQGGCFARAWWRTSSTPGRMRPCGGATSRHFGPVSAPRTGRPGFNRCCCCSMPSPWGIQPQGGWRTMLL